MNLNRLLIVVFVLLAAAGTFWFLRLGGEINANSRELAAADSTIRGLEAELESARRSLDSLRSMAPGLGDYMSAVQLHAAKLWFAGRAGNWKLASYELGELGETMDAAGMLHEIKNGVDITGLLRGVQQAQLTAVRRTVDGGNLRTFQGSYGELLAACNGCHRSAGYPFIHIVLPSREPVTNQQWSSGGR